MLNERGVIRPRCSAEPKVPPPSGGSNAYDPNTPPLHKCDDCQGYYEHRILWRGMCFRCGKCHENKLLKNQVDNLTKDLERVNALLGDKTNDAKDNVRLRAAIRNTEKINNSLNYDITMLEQRLRDIEDEESGFNE